MNLGGELRQIQHPFELFARFAASRPAATQRAVSPLKSIENEKTIDIMV
jgi:hypothetical protein